MKLNFRRASSHLAAVVILFGCASQELPLTSIETFSKFDAPTNSPLRPEFYNKIGIVPLIDAVNAQKSGALLSVQIQNSLEKYGFKTSDRIFLNSVMRERANIMNGLFVDKELQELGSQLKADYILSGIVTKYKSTTRETKGDEVSTIDKSIFGTSVTTIHSENSIRETYSTGARIKIFNVSTGTTEYEYELSIDDDSRDNLKSFEAAFNRHLMLEWVKAKRDSIVDNLIDSNSTPLLNSKVRSIIQDKSLLINLDSSELHHYYKIITDSASFFAKIRGKSNVTILGPLDSKYMFVDGELFGKALVDAVKFHFAWGDSISCIKSISLSRLLNANEKEVVQDLFDKNWNSFSEEDQAQIDEDFDFWINTSKPQTPSVFKRLKNNQRLNRSIKTK